MTCVVKGDGSITRNQKEMLKVQSQYYRVLYQVNINIEFVFINNSEAKLSEEERNECDKDTTVDELYTASQSMNKVPGCDGLSMECYLVCWPILGPKLLDMTQHGIETGHLSRSAKRDIISLTPKKDRDTRYIKKWRSLTLLNTDYKIFAKALALRIKPLLPKLIHKNQTGFISGRHISHNIRTVMDIIDIQDNEESPGIILSLDFEKAYDCVEIAALRCTFEYFNFGPKI